MTDVDPKARIAGVFDRAAPTDEQTGVEFFTPPRVPAAREAIGAVLDKHLRRLPLGDRHAAHGRASPGLKTESR